MDIFGYPIKLNFNSQGDTHKTTMGGISTLIYYLFTAGYTFYCFYVLINNLQDTDNLITTSLDLG